MDKPNDEKKEKEVTITGRLGADAAKGVSTNKEKPYVTFSVADNSKGETKWHNVQMWDKNIPEVDLKKGDVVELKGSFKSYETKSGMKEEFVATEVTKHTPKLEASVNKTEVIKGNLGQDPKIEKVNEKDVASFSVAMKGDTESSTTWQNVQVWNKNIDNNKIAELKKGDFVELTGHYGKEYQNSKQETKKDFILESSKVLKKAEAKAEKQSEAPVVKAEVKVDEKPDQKKSKGMKM